LTDPTLYEEPVQRRRRPHRFGEAVEVEGHSRQQAVADQQQGPAREEPRHAAAYTKDRSFLSGQIHEADLIHVGFPTFCNMAFTVDQNRIPARHPAGPEVLFADVLMLEGRGGSAAGVDPHQL